VIGKSGERKAERLERFRDTKRRTGFRTTVTGQGMKRVHRRWRCREEKERWRRTALVLM